MVVKRVWFFILAIVLMAPTLALADDYLRVSKNGVIFYHYNNRISTQPRPEGKNPLALRSAVPCPEPSAPRRLLPASKLQPIRTDFTAALPPGEIQVDFSQGPSRPEAPTLPQLPLLSEALETAEAARQGLAWFLTRLSFFDPPDQITASETSPWLTARQHLDQPFIVTDAWEKAPKYFPEPPGGNNVLAAPAPNVALPKYVYHPRLWGKVAAAKLGPRASSSLYYCFPVARPFNFRDSWGDPRPNGRIHRAVDVFAPEGTELYAITSGVIRRLGTSQTGGIMLFLAGNDGHGYAYMHLMAYADGITVGKTVQAGELIGYVGHTGTINCPDHLHLQVYPDHNFCHESLIDPYTFLAQLCRGIGVTDFNQPRVARRVAPKTDPTADPRFDPRLAAKLTGKGSKNRWIQVNRNPWLENLGIKYSVTPGMKNLFPTGREKTPPAGTLPVKAGRLPLPPQS